MVVVADFYESLDLRPLLYLLLSHPFGDFPGVTIDSSDQGVGIRLVGGTVVIVLRERHVHTNDQMSDIN